MSTLDHKLEPEVTTVRRLEGITGAGRRRQFTEDFKARVVGETLAPGVVVSEVARRHGLTPQQVFTWRRQARQAAPQPVDSEAPTFVPAVVETALPSRPARKRSTSECIEWIGTKSPLVVIDTGAFAIEILSGRAGVFDRPSRPFAQSCQGKPDGLRMTSAVTPCQS